MIRDTVPQGAAAASGQEAPPKVAGSSLSQPAGGTLRDFWVKVLKIGAQIYVSVRRIVLSLATSYPWQAQFAQVHANLRC